MYTENRNLNPHKYEFILYDENELIFYNSNDNRFTNINFSFHGDLIFENRKANLKLENYPISINNIKYPIIDIIFENRNYVRRFLTIVHIMVNTTKEESCI